jgi:hypothetical protein
MSYGMRQRHDSLSGAIAETEHGKMVNGFPAFVLLPKDEEKGFSFRKGRAERRRVVRGSARRPVKMKTDLKSTLRRRRTG